MGRARPRYGPSYYSACSSTFRYHQNETLTTVAMDDSISMTSQEDTGIWTNAPSARLGGETIGQIIKISPKKLDLKTAIIILASTKPFHKEEDNLADLYGIKLIYASDS